MEIHTTLLPMVHHNVFSQRTFVHRCFVCRLSVHLYFACVTLIPCCALHSTSGDGQPSGNMGVGDSHLEAIGHLTQLKQITLRVSTCVLAWQRCSCMKLCMLVGAT